MTTVRPMDDLPVNWPDFVGENCDELSRLFGPAYAQSYREAVSPYLRAALRTERVFGWRVGPDLEAFGLCTGTISEGLGRITWLHVLRPYRGQGLEEPLLATTVLEMRNRGCRRILTDFIPLDEFVSVGVLGGLGFCLVSRQLMIANSVPCPTDAALDCDATGDTLDGMAEVLAATYANHPGLALHPEAETFTAARAFARSIAVGAYGAIFPGHIQVARAGSRVAGFAVGAAPGAGVAFLFHVAVAPEFQNRGYGGRVVRAFLRSAGAAGYPRTALGVTSANPARHLYERLGFELLRHVEVYHWPQSEGMSPGQ